MVARLGNVLYWLGCVAALVIFVFDAALWKWGAQGIDNVMVGVLAVFGFAVWLVGRACRYVLSGT